MKNIKITLTERELEVLQISLFANKIDLEEEIEYLANHNETGVHTWKIEKKFERINECVKLWHKLYDAELTA